MSYRFVLNQLGLLLLVLSGVIGVIGVFVGLGWAFDAPVQTPALWALVNSALVGALIGGALVLGFRKGRQHLGRREALFLVALSWLAGAALSALPFFFWAHLAFEAGSDHPFRSYIDCYFEAMSGLTTTGATVLSDIEAIPPSLLVWRALTQWLGGLGIVVLFVAVLPSLGVGGKKLFRVEAPGPKSEGLQPQIRETARVLWYIYLALTGIQILALRLAGMTYFDAMCHTFTTLATGGFSTNNYSIGGYDGLAIRWVTIVFMILAGMNFGLFYQLYRKRLRNVLRDVELRLYLMLLLIGSALVFVAIQNGGKNQMTDGTPISGEWDVATEAVFTTVSIQTTTGFCSGDYELWPFAAKAVLILFMFIGGSSGSTSGGIKVIRIWIAFKVMLAEIERVFRPNVIRPVKVGGGNIDADLKLSTLAYVLGIVILFVAGSASIMLLEQLNPVNECTYTSAASATIATLCTIGPGLEQVGATQNYGWFSPASKLVMCVLMALGRLEVFAIIVLFSRRFWKAE